MANVKPDRRSRLTGEDPAVQARFDRASAATAAGPLLNPVKQQKQKEKVVRLTVSMPESDSVILNELRALMTRPDGVQLNQSQVIRAAVRALRKRSDAEIRKAASSVVASQS